MFTNEHISCQGMSPTPERSPFFDSIQIFSNLQNWIALLDRSHSKSRNKGYKGREKSVLPMKEQK